MIGNLWFHLYLVINGGIQFSRFIPDQEEEIVTDWIINIDTGVWRGSNKNTGKENEMAVKSSTSIVTLWFQSS